MNNTSVTLSKEELERFEPTAKILAANGIAQSLSFTSERKYLNVVTDNSSPLRLVVPCKTRIDSPPAPFWIKISRVGKPLEKSPEKCFSGIQKILSSCFIPHKTQLLFVVRCEKGEYEMYMGIRSYDKTTISDEFVDNLARFIEGVWIGTECKRPKGNLDSFISKITDRNDTAGSYDFIDCITGIPSMESQYNAIYPATIDTLLAGMYGKDFAYMVIANPIPTSDVDGMLYQCRDFCGQAESLKSFNFSENLSSSLSKTIQKSKTITDGTNESEAKKSAWGLVGAGLTIASFIFPPAGAITTAIAIAGAANKIAGSNLLAEFTPTYTTAKSHSVATTEGESNAFSSQQGRAISNNIVNKQIEAVSQHLSYHSRRFETGKAIGCWSVGVYLMSNKKAELQSASMQLKSIISGQESVFEPIRVHHIQDVLFNDDILSNTLGSLDVPIIKVANVDGEYFQHPLGTHFNDLRTVLTTKELSYLVNFPLRSVPGISVIDSSPEYSLNVQDNNHGIAFGNLLYGGSETSLKYSIPSSVISRHSLICGINGSGKTNTIQSILNGIGKLPFLVIEPAKTEYVDWAIEYNKKHPENQIDIYIPGCKSYRGSFTPKQLKLNPLDIVWLDKDQDPNVLSHIDRLKSTFAAAFPMYDILPVLMEELIYSVYQNDSTNWLTKQPIYGKTMAPTLNSMRVNVDTVVSGRQYEAKVQGNMKACLCTRIDSLKRGWKNSLLNAVKSTPWEQLFDKPCVINLSYVGDDLDKSFIMAVLLQFLYEYRNAQAECGFIDFNSNDARHLTIIEEAHRVMSKCDNQELPQYKSAMMFSNMLSEIRAYGEGLMLVDQVPTRLIPDAIKNTNLKIVHRLVAEDDVKAVGEAMSLSDQQRKVIPKLLTGQCIVSSSASTDVYWVKAYKSK